MGGHGKTADAEGSHGHRQGGEPPASRRGLRVRAAGDAGGRVRARGRTAIVASLLLVLLLAGASRAAELKEGTWLLGLGPGGAIATGAAKSKTGPAIAVSGYVLKGNRERSWGLSIDRFAFSHKGDVRVGSTSLLFTGRANFVQRNNEVVPYVLGGVGWCEVSADLAGGATDRATGAAFHFGAGFHRIKDSSWSWGVEARLVRAGAGPPRLGVGGLTILTTSAVLLFRIPPDVDWFSRPGSDRD